MTRMRSLLAGLLQLLVGGLVINGVMVAVRFWVAPGITAALSLDALGASIVRRLGIFLVVAGSYAAFVRLYERRAPDELRLRPVWLLAGATGGALATTTTILVLLATGHYHVLAYRGWAQVGDVLGPIGVAAFIEEVTFRGLLFRILEERAGTRWALAVSSIVFCVSHVANGGFGLISLISVTLAGLMWAGVYAVSRNLWVVSAHHACWNAAIFLSGLPLSGEETWRAQAPLVTEYRGPVLWTGGAFGPEDSLVNIASCFAICVGLWTLARKLDPTFPRRARTQSSGRLRPPPPAPPPSRSTTPTGS